MKAPENFKYANTDEWALLEDGSVTVGVSDYAQEQLSDVVFVEVTVEVGDEVFKNTHIATIESVKAAADVNSPVSGKIVAVNEALANTPELVNTDPFGQAWLVKIAVSDPKEMDTLMDTLAYTAFCDSRGH